MAAPRVALALLCCVACAAHQEMLYVKSPKLDTGIPWPVDHTETDFVRVAQEALSNIMDTSSVINNAEMMKARNPESSGITHMGPEPYMVWKVVDKEPKTGLFLDYPHGCMQGKSHAKTACRQNLLDGSAPGKVNIVHSMPFTSNATLSMLFKVDSFFVHQKSHVHCKACGAPCQGTFMGRKWNAEMPECPIQAGTWSLTLPFLSVEEMSAMPQVPSFTLGTRVEVQRGDGTTSVAFEGVMQA
eukprot:CAMPEP_0204528466 /NCGR_PEP_ID=MMETSP0661-20131031/9538_1 /ASSEMBLY_ACC=CAM_ASM_000606 /TAXON_ID=109239 /ORGANISM="Alexandrium margalefi, Strain AMGDE01CS-322" /LENGTH=242 /DNA_ID=CAMNT_0051534447 /DNA_START=86 /DNA_END=814 /DNA_ORIENTATION=+